MKEVEIYWKKIGWFSTNDIGTYSNLEEKLKEIVDDNDSKILDGSGLYAIIADNKKILYIGQTNNTIKIRLTQDHPSYKDIFDNLNRYEDISVIAGKIIPVSQERVTETLIKDAEACLIYKIKPEFNDQNINTYKNDIKVINMGYFFGEGICSCDENEDD